MKPSEILIVTLCISAILAEHPQVAIFKERQIADQRIVGGINAERRQFPYQVSLHYKLRGHICGGSILTQEWVLTAANCVVGRNSGTLKVVAGLLNLGEYHPDVQTVIVSEIYKHPGYPNKPVVAPNDIALLRLATPLKLTPAVQPISLPQRNEDFTGNVLISGWGLLSSSDFINPETLQYVELPILACCECNERLQPLVPDHEGNKLDENVICAFEEEKGACLNDNGGPMVQNGILLGVHSWSLETCGTGPSFYTKVSSFIPFIKKYVRDL